MTLTAHISRSRVQVQERQSLEGQRAQHRLHLLQSVPSFLSPWFQGHRHPHPTRHQQQHQAAMRALQTRATQ
jgi:hypothetical protein